ncbi:MAG: hypothetical protein GY820_14345 [Gammaproteobacteria bacterium]|nr:hypothetical protein [Gammaproteobacteria bacterium]
MAIFEKIENFEILALSKNLENFQFSRKWSIMVPIDAEWRDEQEKRN